MRRNRGGFSLIEAMIASALLGVGVAALAQTFTNARRGLAQSSSKTIATELAMQRLEELAGAGIAGVPPCVVAVGCKLDERNFTPPQAPAADPVTGGTYACSQLTTGLDFVPRADQGLADARFRMDTRVEIPADPSQFGDARLVSVSVCWQEPGGTVDEIEVSRLVVPGV